MLKMTTQELKSLKLIPNRVLVRLQDKQSEITTESGLKLMHANFFSEEKHAPVTGIVFGLPPTLIPEIMPWETEIALQLGDDVVFSYEAALDCTNPHLGKEIHDEENNRYFLLDYEDIFVARRRKELIPVNGYLLVEPIIEEYISQIELPEEKSGRIGRVAFTSPRNKRYFAAGRERNDVYDFTETIKVGDMVVFSRYSDLPVEYELHNSIDGKKQYFRMQRRDIYHIIDPSKITGVKISLAE